MIFPITELLNEKESTSWVEKHFHPRGLQCPQCAATTRHARQFRTRQGGFVDWRCQQCERVYNLYSGTIFARSNLDARRVVLLLRGICKGESSAMLATELSVSRVSVHKWRKRLQANAYEMLSERCLTDAATETDEMFQNAGEKRRPARRPA